jgi:hypothetical protein
LAVACVIGRRGRKKIRKAIKITLAGSRWSFIGERRRESPAEQNGGFPSQPVQRHPPPSSDMNLFLFKGDQQINPKRVTFKKDRPILGAAAQ